MLGLLPRLFTRARSSLRAKFIIALASLIILLMAAVTFVVDRHQRQAVLEQARVRAMSLARGLAAVSEGYLLSYNFIQLEQVIENIQTQEEDVEYALAHRRDGRVAVYSGRIDLQGKRLDDQVTRRALAATEAMVQEVVIPQTGGRGYDVAIPIYAPGGAQKWGTIRLGFSLQRADTLIHKTRRDLFIIGLVAVLSGVSLAVYMAMRIARPIGQLVAGVHEFAKGSYDHAIRVDTRDEIGYLAASFQELGTALQLHRASLEDEKRLLEEANGRLRATQQQLIESERLAAVGKLAARVAHEVNNPLAIIKTGIRIIRSQSPAGDSQDPNQANLQEIEEEIGRIARIVRELLDVSRPSSTREVVQVNEVIRSLHRLLAQSLGDKQIALSVALDGALPPVQISADQLKQVILNMVRNAEDAMPSGGRLSIKTARQGDRVELSIADTGCGIPEEHLRHVFDPFFTTKAKEQGMGLGLWVSYGVIQAANGSIVVESDFGKGSTFRVSLPACRAEGEGHEGEPVLGAIDE
jgi:two-component system NtrC family sensor kinase